MAAPAPAPSQNGTDSLFPPAQNETASFFGQRLPVAPLSQHEGCLTNVSGTPIYTCFTQNSTSDNQILTSCATLRLACPQPRRQCTLGVAQLRMLAPARSRARAAERLTHARCMCRLWFCLVGGSVCLLLFGLLRGLLRTTYHKRLVRRPPAELPAGPSRFTTLLREPARQAHRSAPVRVLHGPFGARHAIARAWHPTHLPRPPQRHTEPTCCTPGSDCRASDSRALR